MKKLIAAAAVSIISLIGVAATSEAEGAEARCGMTIRTKVKLTQDLYCTETTRPLTLSGNRAHLDLNGHAIFCGYAHSVNLRGQGALIRNGTLMDCPLRLLEGGGHKVRNLTVDTLEPSALVIRSDSNEVVFSTLTNHNLGQQAIPAVLVAKGNYNLLSDNQISNDQTALRIEAPRTIVVNNGLSVFREGEHQTVEILSNFNRIMGNHLYGGCIAVDADTIENKIVANDQSWPELACD